MSLKDPLFAKDVQRELDAIRSMFISPRPFVVAELTAALAEKFPWRLAIVSDGASDKYVAISNGTGFFYLEGTAV